MLTLVFYYIYKSHHVWATIHEASEKHLLAQGFNGCIWDFYLVKNTNKANKSVLFFQFKCSGVFYFFVFSNGSEKSVLTQTIQQKGFLSRHYSALSFSRQFKHNLRHLNPGMKEIREPPPLTAVREGLIKPTIQLTVCKANRQQPLLWMKDLQLSVTAVTPPPHKTGYCVKWSLDRKVVSAFTCTAVTCWLSGPTHQYSDCCPVNPNYFFQAMLAVKIY